jgi:SecD/SecF fusion protein
MRRNFLLGLLVCLVPNALAGLFVGLAFYRESHGQAGFRRGIDLAGGTILVYEVNLDKERAKDRSAGADPDAAAGLTSEQIRQLAENLKRRIDPNDMKNVLVRPLGTSRVEIILPYASSAGGKAGSTENEVQEVKNLVGQVGVLEFRILANITDDPAGIKAAQDFLAAAATDPDRQKLLDERARAGLPPPTPPGDYTVLDQDGVTYEWIPLAKEEMRDVLVATDKGKPQFDSAGKPKMTDVWERMRANPGRAYLHQTYDNPNERRQISYLLYSRKFVKAAPSRREEWKVGKNEYFVLARVSRYDGLKVDNEVKLTARVDTQSFQPAVRFNFDGRGAQLFGAMTERNRPVQTHVRSMAIIMDGEVVSAPYLGAILREGGQISGPGLDLDAVKQLVRILQSGALNAELKPDPVSENTVGPTLGQDTIRKGLMSIGLSFLAILGFMLVYYRFAGFVASTALLSNLLLTIGFMVAVNAAFTLPGLAGLVLMLGMAVDANVLIYERLREERDRGANLATAIRNGYDRAFVTIIDTHLTSIFTCLVLYTFGNDNLKGFAVSLTVGLVISLFTSLYMTRLMFDFWLHKRWLHTLRMMRFFSRPSFDFMKIRHYMFALTGFLTVAGLGLFLYRGESVLNVDFTKGTLYGGRLRAGEERPLGGPDGLLMMLGEERQATGLKVREVDWLTRPVDDGDPDRPRRAAEYVYEITYEDGQKAVVTMVNPPDGKDVPEQLADVARRASHLPGLSVEQVFLSGTDDDLPGGTSRSFTVRTTEKEPELVQVMLDRLLRGDGGRPLLESTRVTNVTVTGPTATVTLDKPASPNYLKGFVQRQLRLTGRESLGGSPTVEVAGVKTQGDDAKLQDETRTGRFATIQVDVSKNTQFRALKEAADQANRIGVLAGGAATASFRPEAVKEEAEFAAAVGQAIKTFESRPLPDRLETFDPALAADTRNKAVAAILASWLAILAYLWFRFGSWTFGLAAVLCLVHDLCFTLGAIAACHYVYDTQFGRLLTLHDFKIDLAAVAALLTLVGYSVNEIIVNFARIREVRGKNPLLTAQTINDSVNQTLSRTILTSTTVFLVSFVLFAFGGEGVHLFAFVMAMGVLVSTYSSIYIASPLLLLLGEGKPKAPAGQPAAQPAAAGR